MPTTATATAMTAASASSSAADTAAAEAAATSSSARKRKRVSRACDQCWVRKDKCDGASPACSICARLARDCTYTRPEKKRGPQQGVRGRLEAQCAALEAVLGWILHCAELEAASAASGLGDEGSKKGHQRGSTSASMAVRQGTLIRLLTQPTTVATSALWSSALSFPPPSSSLYALALRWRRSVLATYITSPLAPASPGLAIGLEGAASVADGLDQDLARRQAAGESGLLGSSGDAGARGSADLDTDGDAAHLLNSIDMDDSPRSTSYAPPMASTTTRPAGKTRRILEPPQPPPKPPRNPAATYAPVSRGPPPPRTSTSSDNGSASGGDVWAQPPSHSMSGSTPSLWTQKYAGGGAGRDYSYQHDATPVLAPPPLPPPPTSSPYDWFRPSSAHQHHGDPTRNDGMQASPHKTSYTLAPMPSSSTAEDMVQSNRAGLPPALGEYDYLNMATHSHTASFLPPIPAYDASMTASTTSAPITASRRETFSFTDPSAQALLYALGLSAASMAANAPAVAATVSTPSLATAPAPVGGAAAGGVESPVQAMSGPSMAYSPAAAPTPSSAHSVSYTGERGDGSGGNGGGGGASGSNTGSAVEGGSASGGGDGVEFAAWMHGLGFALGQHQYQHQQGPGHQQGYQDQHETQHQQRHSDRHSTQAHGQGGGHGGGNGYGHGHRQGSGHHSDTAHKANTLPAPSPSSASAERPTTGPSGSTPTSSENVRIPPSSGTSSARHKGSYHPPGPPSSSSRGLTTAPARSTSTYTNTMNTSTPPSSSTAQGPPDFGDTLRHFQLQAAEFIRRDAFVPQPAQQPQQQQQAQAQPAHASSSSSR